MAVRCCVAEAGRLALTETEADAGLLAVVASCTAQLCRLLPAVVAVAGLRRRAGASLPTAVLLLCDTLRLLPETTAEDGRW